MLTASSSPKSGKSLRGYIFVPEESLRELESKIDLLSAICISASLMRQVPDFKISEIVKTSEKLNLAIRVMSRNAVSARVMARRLKRARKDSQDV